MTIARSVLLLAVLVAGCGSDPEASGTDSASAPDAEATPTGDQLFDRAFAQVCRGTAGQAGASAYAATPGIHPFLTLASDDGVEYRGTSAGTYPDGWRVAWPDLAQAELVVCAHRVSATPAQLCDGYEDDDSGATWSVQTHDAVYEYVVRVAQTGEVIGSTKFEVPAGSCPMFSMHRDTDPDPKPSYPTPSDGQVEIFVRPFVQGE